MIFVTVGTNEARFDRLLHAVERLGRNEEVIAQCGSSAVRPANATCVDYLPFETIVDHVRRARAVVMHAGIGSMMVAFANGKQPIVVPRLKRFHEAVDDHQVPLARRLAERGLVRLVEDVDLLPEALGGDGESSSVAIADDGQLSGELRSHLAELVGRRS